MKRILLKKHGGPDSLLWTDYPELDLTEGTVSVGVLACGVAYADVMASRGAYPLAPKLPFTPGYDFVGRVAEAGRLNGPFLKGQLVAGLLPKLGSYSERLVVSEDILVAIPATLNPVTVASMVLNYFTAYTMLNDLAGLKEGQSVLVHGGGGGIGTAVLDLGRHLGLSVYGTASSGKHEVIKSYGGMPIDYKSVDFVRLILQKSGGEGVDCCLDPIGGSHLKLSLETVRKGGTLISYGFAGENGKGGRNRATTGFLGMSLMRIAPNGRKVRFFSSADYAGKDRTSYRKTMEALFSLLEEGKLEPHIGKTFPLEKASEALSLLESKKATGKIVLTTKLYEQEKEGDVK